MLHKVIIEEIKDMQEQQREVVIVTNNEDEEKDFQGDIRGTSLYFSTHTTIDGEKIEGCKFIKEIDFDIDKMNERVDRLEKQLSMGQQVGCGGWKYEYEGVERKEIYKELSNLYKILQEVE